MIGEQIEAMVPLRLTAEWDLGELMPAAYSRFLRLLRMAKNSANSWGNDEDLDKLVNFEDKLREAYLKTQAEQWTMNPSIHYNEWGNFSSADMRPVVDAFKNLIDIFHCPECGSLIYVSKKNRTSAGLRCNCEHISWNLLAKDEAWP